MYDHRDLMNQIQAAKISLKFSLPECLLPFKTQSIELHLDMNAPNRTVKLMNTGGAEKKILTQLEGPSIPWSKWLAADELSIDAEGNFICKLKSANNTAQSPGKSTRPPRAGTSIRFTPVAPASDNRSSNSPHPFVS